MVRISIKHIAAVLIVQTSFFMNAYAAGEPSIINKDDGEVALVIGAQEYELRNASKDKPFELSAGISLGSFHDLQKYGAQYKFAPSKWKHENENNPKVMDAFTEVYVAISKEINIFGGPLALNLRIEKEEARSSLDLSNLYVENKWFKLGKAPGNFCTYISEDSRYSAYQIAFKYDLGNGYSYTIALEDAPGTTVRTREEEIKDKIAEVITKDSTIVKVKTIEDNSLEPKLFTSKSMPQIALAANVMYKQDWGNIKLSGLGTVVEYSLSTSAATNPSYNYKPMFGAAVSGKYIFVHNEEYEDKEETLAGLHIKYRSGLGAYHGEAGGLTDNINPNFCISKNGAKIVANLQSLGFGINAKHVWTKNFYSSFSSEMFMLLNSNKIEGVELKDKYNNAFKLKISPIAFNIAKNFSLAPSYNLGVGNVISEPGMKKSTIQRLGLDISYDL